MYGISYDATKRMSAQMDYALDGLRFRFPPSNRPIESSAIISLRSIVNYVSQGEFTEPFTSNGMLDGSAEIKRICTSEQRCRGL